jgi:ribulose bisphosphate carboxylase small subunit
MNPMMMNNMGMGMNPNMMNQMMNILNNTQNVDQNNNNQANNINIPNQVQVPDLTEQIKKQEEEKKKKLIKQIINQESGGQEVKHCKELEVISDMAVMGSITRGYIQIDTQNNPNKYISTQNALNSPEQYYRVLGILSEYLSKQGVVTAIEKKDQNQLSKEKLKEIDTFLQFLINGLSNLKKHELKFDFGWEKNQLILTDIEKQDDFMDELRYALHKGFNIPTNQMVITYPRSGSVLITVAFGTEDYNNITVQQLQSIFQQHAPDLNRLQSIDSSLVLDGILLNPELLDSAGNNLNQGWGYNEKRGGRPYYPPQGWKGYGLKVVHKYDHGNDDWLAYNGRVGEWCVAYHGATQKNNQNYAQMRNDDDANHPGKKVGEGVYCSPKPSVLDSDGGIVQSGNKRYKIGFMLRVKPDKIRIAKSNPDYWVLNGNSNEIRPYRILIKEI